MKGRYEMSGWKKYLKTSIEAKEDYLILTHFVKT